MTNKQEVEVKDWKSYSGLDETGFDHLAEEYIRLNNLFSTTKKALDKVKDEIKAAMQVCLPEGVLAVNWNGVKISLIPGTSASLLDPIKLLALGVSPDIIVAATNPGTDYFQVRAKEGKE